MYAHDTRLTFASNDVAHLEENMNDDLTKITEWLTSNKLTLNNSTTEFHVDWLKAKVKYFFIYSRLLLLILIL